MGYQYKKELNLLKSTVMAGGAGLLEIARVTFLLSACYLLLALIFPSPTDTKGRDLDWQSIVETDVADRVQWLESFPLGWVAGGVYYAAAEVVTSTLITRENLETPESDFGAMKIKTWSKFLARYGASFILLIFFAFLACAPVWFVGLCVGLVYPYYRRRRVARGTDLLAVCERGDGPFYSGIHGPWKPNSMVSGTDFSAPGVAIPVMAEKNVVCAHGLYRTLSQVAPNRDVLDLFTDLMRVVVACAHYPTFVTPESPSDDDVVKVGVSVESSPESEQDKDSLTVESNVVRAVAAFVDAYKFLESTVGKSRENDSSVELGMEMNASKIKDSSFDDYRTLLLERRKNITDIEFALLASLTPLRAHAMLRVPLHVCVSALLALEAGKSFVYQKHGDDYVQVSRYPHLQARAVIQSLASYHKAYDGDSRQILRLAILGSRRHGDYGRPMLPIVCSDSVRALRQWLEISQAHSERVLDNSLLIEFEGHLEELYDNFILNLRTFFGGNATGSSSSELSRADSSVYRGPAVVGFPHRNVVLFPLNKLIELAFKDMSESKLSHLDKLTNEVVDRGLLPRVTVRLPGLSQQLDQLKTKGWPTDSSSSAMNRHLGGAELLRCWRILRHALTRYSWLSTRVGDDLVPCDGLVQALIYATPGGDRFGRPIGGLSSLVPLRRRRFHAIFGEFWQQKLYVDAPVEDAVRVFTSYGAFSSGIGTEGSANVTSGDSSAKTGTEGSSMDKSGIVQ